jgi:hypothetical protein
MRRLLTLAGRSLSRASWQCTAAIRGAVFNTCVNVDTCIDFPCYIRTRCYAEAHESDTAGSAHRSSGPATLDPHEASVTGAKMDGNQLVFAHTSGWRKYTFYQENARLKSCGE